MKKLLISAIFIPVLTVPLTAPAKASGLYPVLSVAASRERFGIIVLVLVILAFSLMIVRSFNRGRGVAGGKRSSRKGRNADLSEYDKYKYNRSMRTNASAYNNEVYDFKPAKKVDDGSQANTELTKNDSQDAENVGDVGEGGKGDTT